MDPIHITHDFTPFFRIHNTGHVERFIKHDYLPASHDPRTDVVSKDVIISSEPPISARIYLPKTTTKPDPKLPLLIYIHGGAFSIESAFSSTYHPYLNTLASKSGFVIVSIEYRLAPEHPIPACYDDSWAAVKWVESHTRVGEGSDPWLNEYVNFNEVFIAGDSAGANLAHNMVIRAKNDTGNEFGFKFTGLILVHPFFGLPGKPDKLWDFICSDATGFTDPRLYPGADMDMFSNLGCPKVLVCVGEKDFLRERGANYYQTLKNSNWNGKIEFFETPDEGHVFHLMNPTSEKGVVLLKKIIGFMKNVEANLASQI